MKDIKEAIQASIATDSIIHATVNAADIYEAMGGVEYDDAIEVDGAYDVWGADEDDNTWRLLVNIQSPEKTYMNPETGSVDTYDGWDYTTEDGEQVNAVDLGEVIEVVMVDGHWREI